MNDQPRYPSKRSRAAQFAVCMVLLSSMQIANAQCASGNVIKATAEASKAAEKAKAIADRDNGKQVLSNAMGCLQNIKNMLTAMTGPMVPDVSMLAMSQIVNFLSNKACQVVVKQVEENVVNPINNTVNGYQSDINGVTRQVNGISGQVGGDVLKQGQSTTLINTGKNVATTVKQVDPQAAPASSVWDKVGCVFGSGSACQ